MTSRIKPALLIAALLLLGLAASAEVRSSEVLWLDFDMKNIPEPMERAASYYEYFFKGQFIEGTKQKLDAPRWARLAIGKPKESSNVNSVDEVPNSSWFTNRHRMHRLTPAQLQRGPNTGSGPDFSTMTVTRAKTGGVTPGLMVKDATGESYLVKFDSADYPNLRSGAEVIATKIMYAAGYNVPENYIAYFDPKQIRIGEGVTVMDPATRLPRPLAQEDIDELLRRVAVREDGRYRVLASKIVPGKSKGPFSQVGMRMDDPNDLIPHEHRREIRALKAISSWINNWDLKEPQSLDVYVEENGRKFLKHYLLDFGSSLGADDDPTQYYHGHEYGLDLGSITRELFSLGLYTSANERRALIISPEVGRFTAADFNPGSWKPTYGSVAFSNMTDLDAFWATRIVLSFSEQDLRSIIETAEYTGPTTDNYVLQTLLDRRRMLANYWLRKADALSDFAVRGENGGVALTFKDLLVGERLAAEDLVEYQYQVRGNGFTSEKKSVRSPEIHIDRETLAAAIEKGGATAPVEISVWARRGDDTLQPVKVIFEWGPSRNTFPVRRISRG